METKENESPFILLQKILQEERYYILEALDRSPKSKNELKQRDIPNVDYHLKVLRRLGLIKPVGNIWLLTNKGREIFDIMKGPVRTILEKYNIGMYMIGSEPIDEIMEDDEYYNDDYLDIEAIEEFERTISAQISKETEEEINDLLRMFGLLKDNSDNSQGDSNGNRY